MTARSLTDGSTILDGVITATYAWNEAGGYGPLLPTRPLPAPGRCAMTNTSMSMSARTMRSNAGVGTMTNHSMIDPLSLPIDPPDRTRDPPAAAMALLPQLAEAMEDLCNRVVLAGKMLVRSMDPGKCLALLDFVIQSVPWRRAEATTVLTLAMRALALVLDLVPRACVVAVQADTLTALAAMTGDTALLANCDALVEEVIRCWDIFCVEARDVILTRGRELVPLLLSLVHISGGRHRQPALRCAAKLFAAALPEHWESLRAVLPALDASLQALVDETRDRMQRRAASGVSPAVSPRRDAATSNARPGELAAARTEETLVELLGCYTNLFDRVVVHSASAQVVFDAVAPTLLPRVLAVLEMSGWSPRPHFTRRAALGALYAAFIAAPNVACAVFTAHGVWAGIGELLLRWATEERTNSFGATTQRPRDAEAAGAGASHGGAGWIESPQAASEEDQARVPPSLDLLLFLCSLMPAAAGTSDAWRVVVPSVRWEWEDDFRNHNEFEPSLCHRIEAAYQLQRRTRVWVPLQVRHGHRMTALRFDILRHGPNPQRAARPFFRRPAPAGFLQLNFAAAAPAELPQPKSATAGTDPKFAAPVKAASAPQQPPSSPTDDGSTLQPGCFSWLWRCCVRAAGADLDNPRPTHTAAARPAKALQDDPLEVELRAALGASQARSALRDALLAPVCEVLRCSVEAETLRAAAICLLRLVRLGAAPLTADAALSPDGTTSDLLHAGCTILRAAGVCADATQAHFGRARRRLCDAAVAQPMLFTVAAAATGVAWETTPAMDAVLACADLVLLLTGTHPAARPTSSGAAGAVTPEQRFMSAAVLYPCIAESAVAKSLASVVHVLELLLAAAPPLPAPVPLAPIHHHGRHRRRDQPQIEAVDVDPVARLSSVSPSVTGVALRTLRPIAMLTNSVSHSFDDPDVGSLAPRLPATMSTVSSSDLTPAALQATATLVVQVRRTLAAARGNGRHLVRLLRQLESQLEALSGVVDLPLPQELCGGALFSPMADVDVSDVGAFGRWEGGPSTPLSPGEPKPPVGITTLTSTHASVSFEEETVLRPDSLRALAAELLNFCADLLPLFDRKTSLFDGALLPGPFQPSAGPAGASRHNMMLQRFGPDPLTGTAVPSGVAALLKRLAHMLLIETPLLTSLQDRLRRRIVVRVVPLPKTHSADGAAATSASVIIGSQPVEYLPCNFEATIGVAPGVPVYLLGCDVLERLRMRTARGSVDAPLDMGQPSSPRPAATTTVVFLMNGRPVPGSWTLLEALVAYHDGAARLREALERENGDSVGSVMESCDSSGMNVSLNAMSLTTDRVFGAFAIWGSVVTLHYVLVPHGRSSSVIRATEAAASRPDVGTAAVKVVDSQPHHMLSRTLRVVDLAMRVGAQLDRRHTSAMGEYGGGSHSGSAEPVPIEHKLTVAAMDALRRAMGYFPLQCAVMPGFALPSAAPTPTQSRQGAPGSTSSNSRERITPTPGGAPEPTSASVPHPRDAAVANVEDVAAAFPVAALCVGAPLYPLLFRLQVMEMLCAASVCNTMSYRRDDIDTRVFFHRLNREADVAQHRHRFVISRTGILACGAHIMSIIAPGDAPLEVRFEDEVGTGSGPLQEFYSLYAQALAAAPAWTTSMSSGANMSGFLFPAYQKGPLAHAALETFERCGRLIGRCLRERRTLPLNLHPLWWEGLRVGADAVAEMPDALRQVDEALYASLRALEQTPGDVLESLDMRYVAPGDGDVPLITGGADIVVTRRNVLAYTRDVRRYVLEVVLGAALDAFRSGLYSAVPPIIVRLFTAQEFNAIVAGPAGRVWQTAEDFMCNAACDHGYTAASAVVAMLAAVVAAWDAPRQRRLLQFVTGSPCVSLQGPTRITIVRRDPPALHATPRLLGQTPRAGFETPALAFARPAAPPADDDATPPHTARPAAMPQMPGLSLGAAAIGPSAPNPLETEAAPFHTPMDRDDAFGSSFPDSRSDAGSNDSAGRVPLPVPAVVRRLVVPGLGRPQAAASPPAPMPDLDARTHSPAERSDDFSRSDARNPPAMDPVALTAAAAAAVRDALFTHGPPGGDDGADTTALTQALIDATLPTVNTCFAYLKLPEYSARDVLERQLLLAITEGQECFALS